MAGEELSGPLPGTARGLTLATSGACHLWGRGFTWGPHIWGHAGGHGCHGGPGHGGHCGHGYQYGHGSHGGHGGLPAGTAGLLDKVSTVSIRVRWL